MYPFWRLMAGSRVLCTATVLSQTMFSISIPLISHRVYFHILVLNLPAHDYIRDS